MQTFLPYPDYVQSAACLDSRRLGKQRVEVLQILRAMANPSYGWQRHPAVKMWKGSARGLIAYGLAVCDEWRKRGFRDGCREKIVRERASFLFTFQLAQPWWLGDAAFHASHRSNLLRKDPKHYGQFGWVESADLPYVWPGDDFTVNNNKQTLKGNNEI